MIGVVAKTAIPIFFVRIQKPNTKSKDYKRRKEGFQCHAARQQGYAEGKDD